MLVGVDRSFEGSVLIKGILEGLCGLKQGKANIIKKCGASRFGCVCQSKLSAQLANVHDRTPCRSVQTLAS